MDFFYDPRLIGVVDLSTPFIRLTDDLISFIASSSVIVIVVIAIKISDFHEAGYNLDFLF